MALSVRSNRAANFAKAEDQAARLAQEGVEVIQDIRNNKPGNVLDDTGAPDSWNWIFNQNFLGSREAYFNNCGADQCLDFSPQPVVPINLPSDSRNFTRRIFVFDDPGGCNEDFTGIGSNNFESKSPGLTPLETILLLLVLVLDDEKPLRFGFKQGVYLNRGFGDCGGDRDFNSACHSYFYQHCSQF